MVLVGQGMGHHADQLLPDSLAGGGEVLGEVSGQHDDEDVPQELQGEGKQCGQHSVERPLPCTGPRGCSSEGFRDALSAGKCPVLTTDTKIHLFRPCLPPAFSSLSTVFPKCF